MNENAKTPVVENQESQNVRFIKIGNTTIEIERYYCGTRTYEEVVKSAIKREIESGINA